MSDWFGVYQRSFDRIGRRVEIERMAANQPAQVLEGVRARLRDLRPEEIAGGIAASAHYIMILAEDVPADWLPLQQSDTVKVDGRSLTFTQRPDDQTHRDREVLLAITGYVA